MCVFLFFFLFFFLLINHFVLVVLFHPISWAAVVVSAAKLGRARLCVSLRRCRRGSNARLLLYIWRRDAQSGRENNTTKGSSSTRADRQCAVWTKAQDIKVSRART